MFGWLFSFFIGQMKLVFMFFAITGAIWGGGSGAVIAGGLYWKRGTTAGAWVGMTLGSALAVLGLLVSLPESWPHINAFLQWFFPNWQFLVDHPKTFPINGQYLFFVTMLCGVTSYVVVSLLTCREPFNMDRMLHRGRYAVAGDEAGSRLTVSLKSLAGISDEHTRSDRIWAWAALGWTFFLFAVFAAAVLWNLFAKAAGSGGWSAETWAFFQFGLFIGIPLFFTVLFGWWFGYKGLVGLASALRLLATRTENVHDDGRVEGGVNAADVHDAKSTCKTTTQ